MTTTATHRSIARPAAVAVSRFGRYALAAAGTAAVGMAPATTRADFDEPYSLNPPAGGIFTSPTILGDWSSTFDGGSAPRTVDTQSAPVVVTLLSGSNFGSSGSLTLSTTIVGTGSVAFGYNFSNDSGSGGFAGYVVNGSVTNFATSTSGGNVLNIPVNAGDTFGFRLGNNYAGSASVMISNFAAPVPEPTVNALIAAGAVGLLGLRETRRRRRARLVAAATV